MKKLIVILLLCISIQGISQKVSVDKDGNYHPLAKLENKKTDKLYIDKDGTKYPVYINSKNKPYIIRKSKKTGKEYKAYLKLD